jgi:hypothetical protein
MNNQWLIQMAIDAERTYQDNKWGSIEDHPHEVGAWLTILRCKLEDAEHAWQKGGSDIPALREMLQVVCVGLACLEQHGVYGAHEK